MKILHFPTRLGTKLLTMFFILAVMLFGGCEYETTEPLPERVPKDEKAIEANEYEVISSFVREYFVLGRNSRQPTNGPFVIINETLRNESGTPFERAIHNRFSDSELAVGIVDSLSHRNNARFSFQRKFAEDLQFYLVSENDISAAAGSSSGYERERKIRSAFVGTGPVGFSRVGFSTDGNAALFYYSLFGVESGYALMRLVDGRWKLETFRQAAIV